MADRYWVGGAASWDGTAGSKWATTSGGSGGAAIPTTSDNVFFDATSGANVVTIATGNTGCANLDCTGFTGTLAGSAALTVAGSFLLVAGMTRTYTGALTFSATSSVNLTFGGKTTASTITFNGVGGKWTLQDAWDNGIANNTTLTNGEIDTNGKAVTWSSFISSSTNSGRILTLGATTLTLGGNNQSLININTSGFTLNANTSTVTMNINSSVVRISGNVSWNNFTIDGAAVNGRYEIASDFTVSGTLTLSGASATSRLLFISSDPATQCTITAATLALDNVNFYSIVGAGAGSWSGTSIGNFGNNSGITFTAAVTRYWVGNGGSWSSTTKWSTSTGGASGASVPLPQDTAVFDANSITSGGQTITCNVQSLPPIDFTNVLNSPTFTTSAIPHICGGLILVSGMTSANSFAGQWRIVGTGDVNINTGGVSLNPGSTFNIDKASGTATLVTNDLTIVGQTFNIATGGFDANDKNVSAPVISSASGQTRSVTMGTGTWTASGTGTVWSFASSGLTFAAETSTVKITDSSATARTFSGGGLTYNNFWSAAGAGTASLTVSGSNTFNDFKDSGTAAHSILFTVSTTQTVTTFTVNGTLGNLITINSTTTGVHTLSKSTGVVSCDYLNIQHSAAQGGATWYAGANSTNNQGVVTAGRGWHFSVPDGAYNFGMMLTQ